VPEVRRATWLERNGLEYLSVGPACGRLFRRRGGQDQQTMLERLLLGENDELFGIALMHFDEI